MTNDYTFSILAEQRRHDFAGEAANDRLARIATADRAPWWRRLVHTHTRSTTRPLTTLRQGAH
jgi:hypothetical protein